MSVLYAVSFDEHGKLKLHLNKAREPIRGGGMGFEQDLLIFERSNGDTSIVPRVIAEVKFDNVTTHDAIVYSEKARRIRTIYPFVRYGLILGQMDAIPARVLRLGQEFDFIIVISKSLNKPEVMSLGKLLKNELSASHNLASILSGDYKVTNLHRNLKLAWRE